MRRLKTFEELKPETYLRAGKGLVHTGHPTRGYKMIDYGHEKNNNLFNFQVREAGLGLIMNLSYVYHHAELRFESTGTAWTSQKGYNVVKDAWEAPIRAWRDGIDDLFFDLDFFFDPTGETLMDKRVSNIPKIRARICPFSIRFRLCENPSSICGDIDLDKISTPDLFDTSQDFFVFLKSNYDVSGIFSNRSSALRFKTKILPGVIDGIGGVLHNVISDLTTDVDDYEEILKRLGSIKVNSLYREEKIEDFKKVFGKSLTTTIFW